MTILDTLKSLLGLESGDRRPETDEDVGVTVEREVGEEPDASTGRSVEGVDEPATEDAATPETAVSQEPAETSVGDEDSDEAAVETEETERTVQIEDAEEIGGGDEAEETEDVEGADETEAADEGDTGVGTDESPDVLEGIGPAYAERLSDAGIETVADLAAADASSLADEADVSETRLERWIERARDR